MGKEEIKVPKKVFSMFNKGQDALGVLENTIIKITSRFNQYGFTDKTEEKFLVENKGKKVSMELRSGASLVGTLELIDKYRIGIKINDDIHYYYKHAIISYGSETD